ncbi:MAG TPA: DUF1015 domain-containing protein [Fimbriimonadaceae bacterium]|nr:DUF1015 domain-containing protein [Fimbriimonadaceae bacterium]
MAQIRPFSGLRYQPSAGSLDDLTAPPYDVISSEQRIELAARSPHNVVHLTLPEALEGDRSKFVKYARSAATLTQWRKEGVLAPEAHPAIYRYTQGFRLPHSPDHLSRTSFIALIKVEPYANGVVLPHEQTFPKHKEDRLRILEATRSHLECIFGLYEDPSGEILEQLKRAPAHQGVSTTSDDGVHQHLEPVTDVESIRMLSTMLFNKKVWIADGHHRYETALAFREALGPKDEPVAEDFMMMALSSLSDPGLVLLPTHRIVSEMPVTGQALLDRLSPHFELVPTQNVHLLAGVEAAAKEGKQAFGLALPDFSGYVLVAKAPKELQAMIDGPGSPALKALDVSVLHGVILEKLVGLPGLEAISYTRDETDAAYAPDKGAGAAFLMVPPTVDDMRTISLAAEKMPQKSTYYFPKILSGLVLWSLNDFI